MIQFFGFGIDRGIESLAIRRVAKRPWKLVPDRVLRGDLEDASPGIIRSGLWIAASVSRISSQATYGPSAHLTWSPDGARLAVGMKDGRVIIRGLSQIRARLKATRPPEA